MNMIIKLTAFLIAIQSGLYADIKVEPIQFEAKQEDIEAIKDFANQVLCSKKELDNLQDMASYKVVRLSSYNRTDITIQKNSIENTACYSLKCGSSYLTLCRHPRIEWDSEVGKIDRLFLRGSLDELSNLKIPFGEKLSDKDIDMLKVTEKNPLWGEDNGAHAFSQRYDTWNYNRTSREPYFVFDKNNVLLWVIMEGDRGSLYLSDWIIFDAKDESKPKFYRVKLRDMPDNILKIFNQKTLDRFVQILNDLLGPSSLEGTIMYTSSTRTRALNVLLQSFWTPWKKYDFTLNDGFKTRELMVDLIFKTLTERAYDQKIQMVEELKVMWPDVILELKRFYQNHLSVDEKTALEYATINSRAILHHFFDDSHFNFIE